MNYCTHNYTKEVNLYIFKNMPYNNKIYYETGGDGLCKMRALNAFLGNNKIPTINKKTYKEYIADYERYLKERFNIEAKSYDLIYDNLISWILSKYGIYARHYDLNEVYNSKVPDAPFLFVYNYNHVWTIIKRGKYYKIDNGVYLFNFSSIKTTKNIGLIIPMPLRNSYKFRISNIKDILNKENIKTKKDLTIYLRKLNKKKHILGDLEIEIRDAVNILEIQQSKNKWKCPKVEQIINNYTVFSKKFTGSNYNNINLIIEYIPNIIRDILIL